MEEFYVKMSEEYQKKHFPKGSVLKEASTGTGTKASAIAGLLFFALAVLFFGYIFMIVVRKTIETAMDPNHTSGDMAVGLVISAVVLLFLVLFAFLAVFIIRTLVKGYEGLIKDEMKSGRLTREEVLEFDRQATQSDSLVIPLKGKIGALLTGGEDAILTRDYLWLGKTCPILKREEIIGGCLNRYSFYANKKKMYDLYAEIVSAQGDLTDKNGKILKRGIKAATQVSEENGRALLSLLVEKCPNMIIAGGTLTEGKEFDKWYDSLFDDGESGS